MNVKKLFIGAAFLLSITANAHDFEIDGIYYNLISYNKVSVTYKGGYFTEFTDEYSGIVAIPETVVYNETTYKVTMIEMDAFNKCGNLEAVIIPDNVTAIAGCAFSDCTSLKTIIIGSGVTAWGSQIFYNCNALRRFISYVQYPDTFHDTFNGFDTSTCALYVPYGTIDTYSNHNDWKGFQSINEIVDVSSISFEQAEATLEVGETADMSPTITPYDATNDIIIWKSSDTGIATVRNGIVTAVSEGTAIVTATVEGHTATCIITATEAETPSEITVSISEYGSATFCSKYALDFRNVEGVKAYTATGYNTATKVITLMRINSAPKGTGLLLTAEPGDYTIPVIAASDDYVLNMLVGTLKKIPVNSTSDDGIYANFKYSIKEGDSHPQFYRFEDNSSLNAGKAYLQLPAYLFTTTQARSIDVRFDEERTTGIKSAEHETKHGDPIHDLTGRIITEITVPGIYIVNGYKKFFK